MKFKLWRCRWLRPRGKKVLLGRGFVPPHNGRLVQPSSMPGRPAQPPQRLLDIIALRACCSSEASTPYGPLHLLYSINGPDKSHWLGYFSWWMYSRRQHIPLTTCGGGLHELSQHSRRQGRWRSFESQHDTTRLSVSVECDVRYTSCLYTVNRTYAFTVVYQHSRSAWATAQATAGGRAWSLWKQG